MASGGFRHGDVVWCKCGGLYWPAEVQSIDSLPKEIQEGFLKTPKVVVKFFDEDGYEFLLHDRDIFPYNCEKKNDFITKGLARAKTKAREGATDGWFAKFPKDVVKCEKLTNGNVNILEEEPFVERVQKKVDYSLIFGDPEEIAKKGKKGKGLKESSGAPRINGVETPPAKRMTHPRFLRGSDHTVRILSQPSTPYHMVGSAADSTPQPTPPRYKCHVCDFAASRVNVMVMHTKSHSEPNRTSLANHARPEMERGGLAHRNITPARKRVMSSKVKGEAAKKPKLTKKQKEVKREEEKGKEEKKEKKKAIIGDWSEDEIEEIEEREKLKVSFASKGDTAESEDDSMDDMFRFTDDHHSVDSDDDFNGDKRLNAPVELKPLRKRKVDLQSFIKEQEKPKTKRKIYETPEKAAKVKTQASAADAISSLIKSKLQGSEEAESCLSKKSKQVKEKKRKSFSELDSKQELQSSDESSLNIAKVLSETTVPNLSKLPECKIQTDTPVPPPKDVFDDNFSGWESAGTLGSSAEELEPASPPASPPPTRKPGILRKTSHTSIQLPTRPNGNAQVIRHESSSPTKYAAISAKAKAKQLARIAQTENTKSELAIVTENSDKDLKGTQVIEPDGKEPKTTKTPSKAPKEVLPQNDELTIDGNLLKASITSVETLKSDPATTSVSSNVTDVEKEIPGISVTNPQMVSPKKRALVEAKLKDEILPVLKPVHTASAEANGQKKAVTMPKDEATTVVSAVDISCGKANAPEREVRSLEDQSPTISPVKPPSRKSPPKAVSPARGSPPKAVSPARGSPPKAVSPARGSPQLATAPPPPGPPPAIHAPQPLTKPAQLSEAHSPLKPALPSIEPVKLSPKPTQSPVAASPAPLKVFSSPTIVAPSSSKVSSNSVSATTLSPTKLPAPPVKPPSSPVKLTSSPNKPAQPVKSPTKVAQPPLLLPKTSKPFVHALMQSPNSKPTIITVGKTATTSPEKTTSKPLVVSRPVQVSPSSKQSALVQSPGKPPSNHVRLVHNPVILPKVTTSTVFFQKSSGNQLIMPKSISRPVLLPKPSVSPVKQSPGPVLLPKTSTLKSPNSKPTIITVGKSVSALSAKNSPAKPVPVQKAAAVCPSQPLVVGPGPRPGLSCPPMAPGSGKPVVAGVSKPALGGISLSKPPVVPLVSPHKESAGDKGLTVSLEPKRPAVERSKPPVVKTVELPRRVVEASKQTIKSPPANMEVSQPVVQAPVPAPSTPAKEAVLDVASLGAEGLAALSQLQMMGEDGSGEEMIYLLVDDGTDPNLALENQTLYIDPSQLAALTGGVDASGNMIIQSSEGGATNEGQIMLMMPEIAAGLGDVLPPLTSTLGLVTSADTSGGIATLPSHPSSSLLAQVPLITTPSQQGPIMAATTKES